MKKRLLSFLLLVSAFAYVGAQNLVSTTPENKKYILEEFTGIHCVNCPAGHIVADQILAANPGNAFVVAYHPNNSSYTTPTGSEPDFRRTFPAAFYDLSYLGGSSRFMPSAMCGRRTYGGTKIISRSDWTSLGNTIMSEASPVNVGLEAIYDPAKDSLQIAVEVYFTGAVTNTLSINVVMTEDSIVGYQSGGSANYTHKRVFREAFTGQWGDAISSTGQGDLNKFKFVLADASTLGYQLDQLKVTAFIYDQTIQENLSGNGVQVVEGVVTSVSPEVETLIDLQVAPNPFDGIAQVNYYLDHAAQVNFTMTDLMGRTVYSAPAQQGVNGRNTFTLDVASSGLSSGVYLLNLTSGDQKISKKVVLR